MRKFERPWHPNPPRGSGDEDDDDEEEEEEQEAANVNRKSTIANRKSTIANRKSTIATQRSTQHQRKSGANVNRDVDSVARRSQGGSAGGGGEGDGEEEEDPLAGLSKIERCRQGTAFARNHWKKIDNYYQ